MATMVRTSVEAGPRATAARLGGQIRMPAHGTVLPHLDEISLRSLPSRRRALSAVREDDVLAVVGAGVGSAGFTWILFTQLAPFSGALGALVVWYLMFLVDYAVLIGMRESRQVVIDRVVAAVILSLAGLLVVGLVFVLVYVVNRALAVLPHLNFYAEDLSVTGPLQPLTEGGIWHGIVGTVEQITIALVITIPLGLITAVYLHEFHTPVSTVVRTIVEAMTALPSIVAGLFIYATWILTLGNEKSGFAAALALSIMMLPIIIRASDVVLRLVPASLTEASLALGAGQWRTIWHVTLPTARSGLATAIILGTARGIGETSPVLLTAGFAQATNYDPLHGPQSSLPLLVFMLFGSPQDTMRIRAFGAATVLLILVLGLFITARTIGGRGPGQLTRRQAARRAAGSRQDAERFLARFAEVPSAEGQAAPTAPVTVVGDVPAYLPAAAPGVSAKPIRSAPPPPTVLLDLGDLRDFSGLTEADDPGGTDRPDDTDDTKERS
jgi:phosphate transport system permease protein